MPQQDLQISGKPFAFIAEHVDWAAEYQKHLEGPDSHIDFSPTTGISQRTCDNCFYRTGPDNPDNDCQLLNNDAKIFFGLPINEVLPKKIDGKEVGHYCPNWVDADAE